MASEPPSIQDQFYQHLLAGGTLRAWFVLHPEEEAEDESAAPWEPLTSAAWIQGQGWSYAKAIALGIYSVERDAFSRILAVHWVGEDHLQEVSTP